MKLIVQGLATQYSDEGHGPVMLMLHGWKDTLHTFDEITRELSHTHRVVRLDMPGFGESEMPEPEWRLDDYVDFVEAFIAKMELEVDVLVGHSFGGRVNIKGLSRGVFHPRKLVLIAAAGVSERKRTTNGVLQMVAKVGKVATLPLPKGVRSKLRRRLYESVGSDYHSSGRLKDIFLNVIGEDLTDAAARVVAPTLLIWGEEDRQTPLTDGEKLSRLIKGSKIEVVEGASHFVHREYPEKVATYIKNFV